MKLKIGTHSSNYTIPNMLLDSLPEIHYLWLGLKSPFYNAFWYRYWYLVEMLNTALVRMCIFKIKKWNWHLSPTWSSYCQQKLESI